MASFPRRSFLFAATGAFLWAGSALSREVPAGTPDLKDPAQALNALLRMQARLDGRDAPWWYFGRIYGLRPGEAPIPLVRFEGLEIPLLTPTGDGEYAATGVTTSFFLDWASKERLSTFTNPVTGRSNAVKPNLIGGVPGKPAAYYSVRGARPGRVAAADWKPEGLRLSFDFYGDTVWLSNDRSYPPGLPQPMGESSVSKARRADLFNPGLAFVPASFSSTYFAPWPAWMEMQGQPGFVVWHADGLKLPSVDELPPHFRSWMEQGYADRLKAPALRG